MISATRTILPSLSRFNQHDETIDEYSLKRVVTCPREVGVMIFSCLNLPDLLNLSLVSRDCHEVVDIVIEKRNKLNLAEMNQIWIDHWRKKSISNDEENNKIIEIAKQNLLITFFKNKKFYQFVNHLGNLSFLICRASLNLYWNKDSLSLSRNGTDKERRGTFFIFADYKHDKGDKRVINFSLKCEAGNVCKRQSFLWKNIKKNKNELYALELINKAISLKLEIYINRISNLNLITLKEHWKKEKPTLILKGEGKDVESILRIKEKKTKNLKFICNGNGRILSLYTKQKKNRKQRIVTFFPAIQTEYVKLPYLQWSFREFDNNFFKSCLTALELAAFEVTVFENKSFKAYLTASVLTETSKKVSRWLTENKKKI